jgi:hypothetical protein
VPETVREIAWKAQTRLCQRYRHMMARGKLRQVVVTAIARELAGFVWSLDKDLEPTSDDRQRQARDAPWSCGNQSAYHSMINRRSVPALHRACLH